MRRHLLGLSVALALTASAAAADKTTPAERLKAIQKEVADAQDKFLKDSSKLGRTKEDIAKLGKLYAVLDKIQSKGFDQALVIARADPKSPTGLAALEWVLTYANDVDYKSVVQATMKLLTEHHAANPKIAPAIEILASSRSDGRTSLETVTLLRAMIRTNPNRLVRGRAALELAEIAVGNVAWADIQRSPDVEKLAATAEKQLEAVVREYGTLAPVGERATAELFELQHLRVGKVAPDIAGEDLDGVKFELSDYRGKVVVLDFWGDW